MESLVMFQEYLAFSCKQAPAHDCKPSPQIGCSQTITLGYKNNRGVFGCSDIKDTLKYRFPGVTRVHIANSVNCSGTTYAAAMVVCHGSTAGLPDFAEVLQIVIVHKKPVFVIRLKMTWYNEHLRCCELDNTSKNQVIEQKDLPDFYPLAAYTQAARCLVTLKQYICLLY